MRSLTHGAIQLGSLSTAVVEGTGGQCCDYMTGGTVVVIGPSGLNFGAGMTNGTAYVYDPDGSFDTRINGESVLVERGLGPEDLEELTRLLERHIELTGSANARDLLDNWSVTHPAIWKVIPREKLRLLKEAAAREEQELVAQGVAD